MLPARYDDDDDEIYIYINVCVCVCVCVKQILLKRVFNESTMCSNT